MENISQPLGRTYFCGSTTDGLTTTIRPSLSFPENNDKVLDAIEDGCLNSTRDENELVEFEMLERLAENHQSKFAQKDTIDKHQSPYDFAKQSKAADALLNNSNQMNNSDNVKKGWVCDCCCMI